MRWNGQVKSLARTVGAVALVLAAGAHRLARADELAASVPAGGLPPSPAIVDAGPGDSQRILGLTLQAGPFAGFGAGLQVGTPDVGVRAAVGWTPLLLVSTGSSDLHFYSTLQVSPDLYVRLLSLRTTTHLGAQMGYRYSSALGHGLAVGGYLQFALYRAVDGLVTGGLLLYPDGEAHLRSAEHLSSSTGFSFPGPNASLGISLGLAFFP
ncbi:hypothetical protein [Anaeromyxobacter diazotrophicus]|uniref:Outer membrane protein beta-barrel domain-containing protein n=1 Tax=Anaeromyxobacter diazotrophicus TaxID=2590199 RepID=A0A7I9VQU4_9BACT|nr:hypothetical protein [Anaeromyxobacter diazotrophicus]GEJ58786.1 hypothetical protein AMYX_35270 [Anaeromyxobacter diazotrophicus]